MLCAIRGLPDPTVNKSVFLFSPWPPHSSLPVDSFSFLLRGVGRADVPRHFGHATRRYCFNGLVKPPTIGFTIRPHTFRLSASLIRPIPLTANLSRIFTVVYLSQVDSIRHDSRSYLGRSLLSICPRSIIRLPTNTFPVELHRPYLRISR